MTNNDKIKINSIHWYVPHNTPSISQQAILFRQTQSKTPAELKYEGRSIFMKAVNTQRISNYETDTQKGINVPLWIFVIFQQIEIKTLSEFKERYFL